MKTRDLIYYISPKYGDLIKELKSDKDNQNKAFEILSLFEEANKADLHSREFYFIMSCRYGCEEGHIYPLGLHLTLESALVECEEHRDYRGGKYECKVYKCTIGYNGTMELVYDQGWHSAEKAVRYRELDERAKKSTEGD